jgi:DNA-directed RNA polymerase specialized sigma subunit
MKNYSGIVRMYNEDIYVDTISGEGYGAVLKKIDPLLCKMASRTHMPGFKFEDIKQELVILAIEGIMAFDSRKKVKLSTFLHIHLKYKLVSKIRSINKLSNDAFSLKSKNGNILCDCDGEIIKSKAPGSDVLGVCDSCGKEHKALFRKSRAEISFSQINPKKNKSGDEYGEFFQDSVDADSSIYGNGRTQIQMMEFQRSLRSLTSSIDPKTAKILELICLYDLSLKDAADNVGITGWAASLKLKKLGEKPRTRRLIAEILNRS